MPGCSAVVLRCRELAGASPPFPEKIAAHRSDTAVHVVHVVPSMQSDGSRQGGSDPVAQQEEGSAVKPPSVATSSSGTQTEYRGGWRLSSCQPQAKHKHCTSMKLLQACKTGNSPPPPSSLFGLAQPSSTFRAIMLSMTCFAQHSHQEACSCGSSRVAPQKPFRAHTPDLCPVMHVMPAGLKPCLKPTMTVLGADLTPAIREKGSTRARQLPLMKAGPGKKPAKARTGWSRFKRSCRQRWGKGWVTRLQQGTNKVPTQHLS